jgi:hypothetical protein
VLSAARAHLSGLQAQASQLSDAFVEGVISIEQMTRANATLLPAIEAARVAVENAAPHPRTPFGPWPGTTASRGSARHGTC